MNCILFDDTKNNYNIAYTPRIKESNTLMKGVHKIYNNNDNIHVDNNNVLEKGITINNEDWKNVSNS